MVVGEGSEMKNGDILFGNNDSFDKRNPNVLTDHASAFSKSVVIQAKIRFPEATQSSSVTFM